MTGGPDRLSGVRARARQLLRQLRSGSLDEALAAARRFRTLRSFAGPAGATLESVADSDALRERARLKHALAVVAREAGCETWTALERALERLRDRRTVTGPTAR